MLIENDFVNFGFYSRNFVKKFGIEKASQMWRDFKAAHNKFPFIYDTFQLAGFLRLDRKELFALTKNCDQHYLPITLKKKNGKERILHAPDDKLKWVQEKIWRHILMKNTVSAYATAYIRRKSLIDNATPHIGKRYLLKIDITDFFGSIRFEQVYGAAFNTKFFPVQIGTMLTTLCCRNDVLPQGAPTSPVLSNLVMRNFDDNIGRWCEKHNISYTRYCDDMTFSSNKPLYHVYQKVKKMLEDMGFELNEKKTRFVTNANRQSVTGLTVNEKLSVSREYKRKLRQEVYYALKYGMADSLFQCGRGEFASGWRMDTHKYRAHLVGKLHYVLQIEPDNQWAKDALKRLE